MNEAEKLEQKIKTAGEDARKKLQEDRDREAADLKLAREKRAEEVNQERRQRREDELRKKAIWPSYPVSDDE
jgi:hypothetical protein